MTPDQINLKISLAIHYFNDEGNSCYSTGEVIKAFPLKPQIGEDVRFFYKHPDDSHSAIKLKIAHIIYDDNLSNEPTLYLQNYELRDKESLNEIKTMFTIMGFKYK